MTKFAYSDWNGWVRQFDTATPSVLPFAVNRSAIMPLNRFSLAFTADKQFNLGSTYGITKTTGPKTETALYTHPLPIVRVRLRMVGGTERIYFSALKAKNQPGPQYYNIYYLTLGPLGYVPTLYTTIDPTLLKIPYPCDPSQDWFYYSGEFAFGDNDTLYLSSGSVGHPCGLYRVDGAGPDHVTGTPVRIHLTQGPTMCLCYKSPSSLFFMRDNNIWKFDVVSSTESFEGALPMTETVTDLAEVGSGLPKPAWWTFISAISKSLIWAAAWVWKTGDTLHVGSGKAEVHKAEPPPR